MASESAAHHLWRKSNVPLVILAVILGLVWWLGRAVEPQETVDEERLAEDDRYQAAAALAEPALGRADAAVLAVTDEIGALSAPFAAGALASPLLLTADDAMPQPTLQALVGAGVEEVLLVGGEPGSEAGHIVMTAGIGGDRIRGDDRYAVSAGVATRHADDLRPLDGRRTAFLVSGQHAFGALHAGPVATAARVPVLLTPPDEPHATTTAALETLDVELLLVIGGEAHVSSEVVERYQDEGYAVERIAGADDRETTVLVAELARTQAGFNPSTVVLVSQADLGLALVAGVHAGLQESPLLLVDDAEDLGGPITAWLTERCDIETVLAVGDDEALDEAVVAAARDAAVACPAEDGG